MTDRHLVTAAHCLAGVESSLYPRVDILLREYNTGDTGGTAGVRRKMAESSYTLSLTRTRCKMTSP